MASISFSLFTITLTFSEATILVVGDEVGLTSVAATDWMGFMVNSANAVMTHANNFFICIIG
jgi:hypothetical protein